MTHLLPTDGPAPAILEILERQVWTDLVAGVSPADRSGLGLAVHDLPGASLLTLARYPQVLDFNRTLDLGMTAPATPQTLEALRAVARDRGVPQLMVGLVPGAQPQDLDAQVLALGARPARAWLQLWRDALAPLPPTPGVEVRPVTSDEHATFAAVMLRGFSMPPDFGPLARAVLGRPGWTHYLAWLDGQAVACGSLYVRGGHGWLGNAATLPGWRRRGAQAALIARRVADAAGAGAHTVFTQVAQDLPDRPNPSEHNMRRAGFRTAYRRDHWILPTGLDR